MKNKFSWKIIIGISMVFFSMIFYIIHYLIFRDVHHIFIYLIGDIAFVFIEVLLVTLIIHQLLNEWEKKSHLKKLNMVIEVFFSEYGKKLLSSLSVCDTNLTKIRELIIDNTGACYLDFKSAQKVIKEYKANIDVEKMNLNDLKTFLRNNRSFLVSLLQNPNLLEHELFTETLMAIFHLSEELVSRNIALLSQDDLQHTKEDIERAYQSLMKQWLSYMEYTQKHFPYFFLFAMETNPFN